MSTVPDSSREKVRRVATYQRAVLLSLLANILLTVFAMAINFGAITLPASGLVVFRIVALLVGILVIGSVIMLAKEFNHIAVAVICGLLTILPIVSLIVLVIFSQKATKYLQQNGIKVGFLGVDPSTIT